MLIIQRPAVEAIGEEEEQPPAVLRSARSTRVSGTRSGTRLRRTLLSSIPGAAVTQVRFDDALHEFTSLPGVKEDVSDIILNLKDLVLVVESDERVTLRVDVRGPAEVTGADLQSDRRRRGAQPGPAHRHRERQGAARDGRHRRARQGATSRPRRASTPRRSGSSRSTPSSRRSGGSPSPSSRRASSSRPTTTGSCSTSRRTARSRPARRSPRPARRCARSSTSSPSSPTRPAGLELGDAATASSGSPDLDQPIEELDLTERPRNCLKRAQINTIGELVERIGGGPARHHELRPEVPRRGAAASRRAWALPRGRAVLTCRRPRGRASVSAATRPTRRRCSATSSPRSSPPRRSSRPRPRRRRSARWPRS